MLVSSGPNLSPMSGAQVALRLLAAGPSGTQQLSEGRARPVGAGPAGAGDVNSLLAYAKTAKALANPVPAKEVPYDPAADVPPGYTMGALVSVDTLEPAYREFAESVGATHVRVVTKDPVTDEAFLKEVSGYLDSAYGGDAAYQAAKSAGQVSIRRQSEVMSEIGDTGSVDISMAFFRGANGSEHFGGGYTGRVSPSFESWWFGQNAAGQYVVPGGSNGMNFVASWAAA